MQLHVLTQTMAKISAVGLACALTLGGCGGAAQQKAPAGSGEGTGTGSVMQATGKTLSAPNLKLASGGLNRSMKIELRELDQEQTQDVERAIRAFAPSDQGELMVNEAPAFYYYDQLGPDEQDIYDALYLVALEPTNEKNYVVLTTKLDPREDAFMDAYLTAYYAMTYDHPELYWLYQGVICEIDPMAAYEGDEHGTFDVYFCLNQPYADYEEQMAAFNEAAGTFLAGVDMTASDAQIAQQVHDKLIDLVTYDDEVAERNANDLAHTAYGCLVADSSGSPHHAVCDGYAMAYAYLLQQCDINAIVMTGKGGATAADADGHAWNLVELDGEWYEVDATWDDAGSLKDQLDAQLAAYPDDPSLPYFAEALDDAGYRDRLQHSLYNLTTKQIENYQPGDAFDYRTKDGSYVLSLVEPSVHIRADKAGDMGTDGTIAALAPEATGTKYAY